MKLKGSITIFISLILITVLGFVSILSESARMNMAYAESKSFTDMAEKSVLAGYGKQIFEDYGILLVWEQTEIREQLKQYIQANINMADLNGEGNNFLKSALIEMNVKNVHYLTEDGGKYFIEQILAYTKYAEAAEAVEMILKNYNVYQGDEVVKKNHVTGFVGENDNELYGLAKEINYKIGQLKDTDELKERNSVVSQYVDKMHKEILSGKKIKDKNFFKFQKEYRKLMTLLEEEVENVKCTIEISKNYERKKVIFLKDNGYTADVKDYINDNLTKLEKVKDKIVENQELNVLEFQGVSSEQLSVIQKSLGQVNSIIDMMESLTVGSASDKDKKNMSVYEKIKSFLNQEILSLVIEDTNNLSDAALPDSNLPTNLLKESDKNTESDIKDKALIALYGKKKFGNFIKPNEDTALQYEMEYILHGKSKDKENLLKNIEYIVGVRTGFNIAYLMTDKEKMTEIKAIATSVAAVMGLPFLEVVAKGIIMTAWATAEAVCDMKALLQGKKIALIKQKDQWSTSLSNIEKSEAVSDERGLDYEAYSIILFMGLDCSKLVFRMMDLIQENIRKRYNSDFLISHCFTGFDYAATYEIAPLFSAMPWALRMLNENHAAYRFTIRGSSQY